MPAFPLSPGASLAGVTLRHAGEGGRAPVFVFPGMEGSGESCLHLALPVLSGAESLRTVVVDYGPEKHASLDDLVSTAHRLVRAEAAGPCLFWAQSFGNLLATLVAERGGLTVERFVLVSPFTRLPPWKAYLGALSLRVTPGFLYRATVGPLGRYLFGPAGDQPDHPFFGALRAAPVGDVQRRTSWLRGRRFEAAFERITAPAHVWLGVRDRLVDLEEQRAFFEALAARRANYNLSMIPGSGHVVLPSPAVASARAALAAWVSPAHAVGPPA
jgi:alpha-beta hydrolase superfamily lysophospholipase